MFRLSENYGHYIAVSKKQAGGAGYGQRHIVGLLFAGSGAATIVNPIDEVLSALNVRLAL